MWENVGFVVAAAVLVYCVVHAFDPPRLNWGDSASDYNAMTAGRNFAKYGFWNLKFTPHVMDPALMTVADSALMYVHYPQLPDVMNGTLRVLGFSDLVQFRFVALCFSFGALFFIYRLIREYYSRQTAQIALGLWVINPLWIQHADYLHHAPYAAFFSGACLYALARYLKHEHRLWQLGLSGLCMMGVFFASYDAWIFIPLVAAFITFGHYGGIRWPAIRVLTILASFAVAALGIKWTTNMWALGGFDAFVRDLRFQFVERATNKAVKVAYHRGIWPTFLGRVERNFSLLLLPIAAFWALFPFFKSRIANYLPSFSAIRANPTWLLAAALPFLCIFTELWVGQYYPALLIVPFYAVACAVFVTTLTQSTTRWAKPLGATIVAALALNSIQENLAFDKAFFDRREIASLKATLDKVSKPGQQILVDHVFDAAYRYYFDRNTVALILNPPEHYPGALVYYTDPSRPRVAPPTGAIFVHHKQLPDQLFDKGYYYILGRQGFWAPWGNPLRYREEIDGFITRRDSQLVAQVARIGEKVEETDFYSVWRIPPGRAAMMREAETPAPAPRN